MIELKTTWNLRSVMASRGIFQTSKLGPLLSERGIDLSREQVYRLVTQAPQRVRLDVLSALCDALECSMDDLVSVTRTEKSSQPKAVGEQTRGSIGDLRPLRATIRQPRDGQV